MTSTTVTTAAVRAAAEAAAAEAAGKRLATTEALYAWGRENGFKVPEAQGRPAKALIEAFKSDTANRRKRLTYVSGAAPEPLVTFDYVTASGRKSKFQATNSEVREWAREQEGLTVGERGRFSQAVRDAYGQAHNKPRSRKAKSSE